MQEAILGELFDRAARECGSRAELARQLGVTPQRLSEWEHGRRQVPPEQIAIIADIAGLVAEEWLVRATLLNSKGKPYHPRLVQALGKWLPRTGAALLSCLLIVGLWGFPGGTTYAEEYSTMCIKLTIAVSLLIKTFHQKLQVYNIGRMWFLNSCRAP